MNDHRYPGARRYQRGPLLNRAGADFSLDGCDFECGGRAEASGAGWVGRSRLAAGWAGLSSGEEGSLGGGERTEGGGWNSSRRDTTAPEESADAPSGLAAGGFFASSRKTMATTHKTIPPLMATRGRLRARVLGVDLSTGVGVDLDARLEDGLLGLEGGSSRAVGSWRRATELF